MVLAHQTMGALSESSSALTAYGPYRGPRPWGLRVDMHLHIVKGVLGGGLPSLSFGLPSSRPFGVAVRSLRSLSLRSRPRLSLWSILLPLLRSGRSALCAHRLSLWDILLPPLWGWPYTRPCPTGYVLLPRCAQAVARPCPTGYVLLPRCAQAVAPSLPYGLRPPPSLCSGRIGPGVPPVPQALMEGLATHGRK